MTCVPEEAEDVHVVCIRTHLISSASAVSLVPRPEDRTRLLSSSLGSFSGPPSSPSLFYTGMLGGGWERGYISLARLPQQLLEQHALLSLMSWAYSTCAVFGLLFQQRAGSGVTFDSTFLRSSVVCVGHFENTIVPYRRSTPEASL